MITAPRFVVLVVLAALLTPTAAGAQEGQRDARDEVRQRRGALAGELDTLTASEAELRNALDALEDEVGKQAAALAAAESAVAAAEAELKTATAKVQATRARVMVLTAALVDRAVESFMNPADPAFDEVVRSKDVAEATRKSALLGHVSATDDDVIDRLSAAEEDFGAQEDEAAEAQARASARRTETGERLAELEDTQAEKDRVREAVLDRQREVVGEIDELAAEESWLTATILAYERRVAAEAARQEALRRQDAADQEADDAAPLAATAPGPSLGGGGCQWPAAGRVTSEFGRRWGRLHAGIDIAAPTGTTIYAAAAGTVIFSGVQGGYGNVVIIDHGGFTAVYAHQSSRIASTGQSVARSQAIGRVGSTGHSTGPHLHFETRYGGTPRNPRGCLP